MRALSDTISSGQEIDALDPSKDLIESFPSSYALREPSFLMLQWAITKDALSLSAQRDEEEEQQFQLDTIHRILEYFPDTISELDKKGQHYMVYVIRSNSVRLFGELLRYNRRLAKLRDGSGKMLIHYCVSYARTPELLYCVTTAMGKSLTELVTSCYDDRGNLPIHSSMQGSSAVQIVKEVLFANTEAVKVPNKDGLYPLHLSAAGDDLEKVKCVFSAYPHAINVVDSNGWLPIQHAAFACKSVEIIKYLHQLFPDSVKRPHQSGRLPLHYAAVNCLSSKGNLSNLIASIIDSITLPIYLPNYLPIFASSSHQVPDRCLSRWSALLRRQPEAAVTQHHREMHLHDPRPPEMHSSTTGRISTWSEHGRCSDT